MNSQNKMLDLLGQAYQTVDDFDKIDALMDDINDYLFEEQSSATISKNLPDVADYDPHLEQHIGQLTKLMRNNANDDELGLTLSHHAQMIMSQDGKILTANSHAYKLLNVDHIDFVNDLPFNSESLATLRQLMKETSAGVQSLERVIYLQIGNKQNRSVFGHCRSIPIGDDKIGLHLVFSYFEWTAQIFKSLEAALNLSESEGLVLQGVLNGQSRAEIAQTRNRSISTIKAQANAILQKSGCENLNELAHLCTSIAYIIGLSDKQVKALNKDQIFKTPRQSLKILKTNDGRDIAYYEYGDVTGQPVLFFHGAVQGPYFLDEMKRKFLKSGLRIIAPSRPHFGYTSAPHKQQEYATTATDDMLALVAHLNIEQDFILAAHHAGGRYAFKFAQQMQARVKGMVMLGTGIPITKQHIEYMNKYTKLAAAASRHAPSVMRLLFTFLTREYRKNGVEAIFSKAYDVGALDKAYLEQNNIRSVLLCGLQHLLEQGAEAFVDDTRSQMLDWTKDFEAVNCQQIWLNGRHCHTMGAHFIEDFVQTKHRQKVHIIEDAGYNILFQSFDKFLETIAYFKQMEPKNIDQSNNRNQNLVGVI